MCGVGCKQRFIRTRLGAFFFVFLFFLAATLTIDSYLVKPVRANEMNENEEVDDKNNLDNNLKNKKNKKI